MSKEREAFESWAYSKKWNIARVRDMALDNYVDDFVNGAWHGWQAKAQAVPEDTTEELQSTANFMRGMCFDPRLHHDIRGAILDRVSRIDGFLEAQDSCCEP